MEPRSSQRSPDDIDLPPLVPSSSGYNDSNLSVLPYRQRALDRERNYYLQYYLRIRSLNMSDSDNSSNIPTRGTNPNTSPEQEIAPANNLPNEISPLLQATVMARRPNDADVNNRAPVHNSRSRLRQPNDPPPTPRVQNNLFDRIQNDLFNDIFNGRFLQGFANNCPNGLTKQEINRHTISYEYKPPKRKRMQVKDIAAEAKYKKIKVENNTAEAKNGEKLPLSQPVIPPTISLPNSPKEVDSCSICFDRFCAGIPVRRLPCLHVFHIRCVDKWLKHNKKCPICRIAITINYENLISSLKSGSSIEQCLSQQESTDNSHATATIQISEFPDLQSMLRSRSAGNNSTHIPLFGILQMNNDHSVRGDNTNNSRSNSSTRTSSTEETASSAPVSAPEDVNVASSESSDDNETTTDNRNDR